MESEYGSKRISSLMTHPTTTVEEGNLSTPGKKLGSSSLSSTCSSQSTEDPFHEDANRPSSSTAGTTGLPKLADDAQLASKNGEKDVPDSSNPNYEQSNHDLPVSTLPSAVSGNIPPPELSSNIEPATQSPPVQVMERPGDPAAYRIPSSVFSRAKSRTPMEWSCTSNESLFSIHMGNMSFTKDQFLLMGKSGELGLFNKSGELGKPGEPTTSGQLMNFSSNQSPVFKTTDIGGKKDNLDQSIGVAEVAAETMREVIRENEEDRSKEKSSLPNGVPKSSSVSHNSDESGTSTKSFAFPELEAEGDKSGSLKDSSEQQQQQQPQLNLQPHTPAAQRNWLSCFSCCPFCS